MSNGVSTGSGSDRISVANKIEPITSLTRSLPLPVLTSRCVNHRLPGQFIRRLFDLRLWHFSILIDKNLDNYFSGNVILQGFIWINWLNCLGSFFLPKPSFTDRSPEWTRPLSPSDNTQTQASCESESHR